MTSRRSPIAVLCAFACLVACPAAGHAVTAIVGAPDLTLPPIAGLSCHNVASGSNCAWTAGKNVALPNGGRTAMPADGTLTSWRAVGSASGAGSVTVNVLRGVPTGGFMSVGTTGPAAYLDGVASNPASLAVRVGDTLNIVPQNMPDYQTVDGDAQIAAAVVAGGAWGGSQILQAPNSAPDDGGAAPNQVLLFNATVDLARPVVNQVTPASGPLAGGTTVTINGDHLAVATGVTFGGAPAKSFSGNNETITAIAPARAMGGAVEVQVTTAGGTSTGGPTFRYPDTTPPVISALAISPGAFRAANLGGPVVAARARHPRATVGASVSYSLSEPGTVTFTIERTLPGRRGGNRCVKPKRSNRHARHCARHAAVRGATFRQAGVAGSNRFTFSGRVAGRALRRGSYRLSAAVVDLAGNRALRPVRHGFRVVR